MADMPLGETLTFGPTRSIRPPSGWTVSGRVADDPLRIQPPSAITLSPPDGSPVSITWRTATWLVGEPAWHDFQLVLDRQGFVSDENLKALYPALIRIAPANISDAQVRHHSGLGPALSITYLAPDTGWAGHVIYAPTGEIEGEVQLLSFEGLEVPYLTHFEAAMASMRTFKDTRLVSV